MVRRLFNILKKLLRPLVLVAVFSLIMAPVIYFFGERIGTHGVYPFKDEGIRFVVSAGLLILSICLFLFMAIRAVVRWWLARRNASSRQPSEEEMEKTAMAAVFDRAMTVIRNRWSGEGRGVYSLPWYLVLGQSGSGKTSLIENGDLRFPIDHEIELDLRELPPRQANHFFSWRVAGNEAVLLDLNGDYFRPQQRRSSVENALWDAFLSNLQRVRPRRPINGIVLAIDLSEFMGMSFNQRENYALEIRRIINDAVDRLGTRMTIHLAFTKLDQVAGFADYFATLSAADREMLYGFHFLYEGRHTPEWLDQFDKQYSEYLDRLHLRLKKRVLELKSANSRQEAFSFYRTFLGLEAPLRSFLEGALSPDKFTTPPLVRGLYFFSNRQENAPRNVFLEAVGQRYALPAPLYGTSQNTSYPYFVTSFLKKVVFPEAGLAGNNFRVEERYRKRILMSFGIGAAACIVGAFYWNDRYQINMERAQDVLAKTEAFSKADARASLDPTGKQYLQPLNELRAAIDEFGDYRDVGPVQAQLTLYQGRDIGPIIDRAYNYELHREFAPALVAGLARNLRSVCPKGGDKELDYLRVYRMMAEMDGRDNAIVDGYFNQLWDTRLKREPQTREQLAAHLDYMLDRNPQAYEVDANLVAQAQRDLSQQTPFRRVYRTIRSRTTQQLSKPLELPIAAGAPFNVVYQPVDLEQDQATLETEGNGLAAARDCSVQSVSDPDQGPFEIPRFFTKKQYHAMFVPQLEQVAKVAGDDLWVLGKLETSNITEADYDDIRNRVRESYVNDYIGSWKHGLNSMQVRPFVDIKQATEILHTLADGNNPIRRVAELVRDNSVLYEPKEAASSEDGENLVDQVDFDTPEDPNRVAARDIKREFADIREMLADRPDGGPSNMDEIEDALGSVYQYMKAVRDASDPNTRSLELAIERAKLAGDDPIFVLERVAERTPAPFGEHLQSVANQSWGVIMRGASVALGRKWHDQVYGAYQRLIAGKYPFNRKSGNDLPLKDFEEFFRPGGILDAFYKQELLTFVDENSGKPKVIDGQSITVDRNFTTQLRAAMNITKSFFNQTGDLSVEFSVAPAGMNANISRAVLNFEGQLVVSSHGPSRPITVFWPNIIDGPASSRVDMSALSGSGRSMAKQFDGPWSFLHLYDAAKKSNLGNNSVDITFANANGQTATFRVRPEARVNAFFNSPLSGFSLPRNLHGGLSS
ncbi:type VI secretion system membrane subunit TssM [Thalassospira marina]|uniref:Type VI secretion system membrane subunit TssM n=1 Tax=Thalassospira marina TaxID=2048283 RepID=A0A2N3KMX6_9PROT|nr:type VI secretion system membrane subunit TssM [Thalassospira marina]PKR51846.1 type VI secretion system membrane subunit TssM [Thalassospira marina]